MYIDCTYIYKQFNETILIHLYIYIFCINSYEYSCGRDSSYGLINLQELIESTYNLQSLGPQFVFSESKGLDGHNGAPSLTFSQRKLLVRCWNVENADICSCGLYRFSLWVVE